MAVIVYNGLQSCLETQLTESRIMKLKLSALPSPSSSASKPPNSQSMEVTFKSCFWDPNTKENLGGYGPLQALSKKPLDKENTTPTTTTNTTTYVHLSEKSLQLCTENLGNETGTDMTESDNCIASLESGCGGKLVTREKVKSPSRLGAKKAKIAMQNFPPPLTTIRGSKHLRVRPHREEGRLVMEAVKVSSSGTSSFQAERSHGRLQLRFLKNTPPVFDSEEDETEQGENEKETEMMGMEKDKKRWQKKKKMNKNILNKRQWKVKCVKAVRI